ncbi:hypothetical protein BDA99DRAFT_544567 [Phascolomyces articulosus]|uniref:Uncharacterized protein n=1 Tax=Phascolomyces articulosus TaxID=60185 RepID=A0AAD5JVP5_9FUNG|nr:hypothetical protein BDA99DRAFT_544567 [Phascolomyces articulosus]
MITIFFDILLFIRIHPIAICNPIHIYTICIRICIRTCRCMELTIEIESSFKCIIYSRRAATISMTYDNCIKRYYLWHNQLKVIYLKHIRNKHFNHLIFILTNEVEFYFYGHMGPLENQLLSHRYIASTIPAHEILVRIHNPKGEHNSNPMVGNWAHFTNMPILFELEQQNAREMTMQITNTDREQNNQDASQDIQSINI